MAAPVIVARVARAHGIRGGLLLDLETEHAEALFQPGRRLRIVGGAAPGEALTVREARPHSGRWLASFDEVADRDAAERLRGAELAVPRDELPDLAEGSYLLYDLIGLTVVEDGKPLGRIREVYDAPANPLLGVEVEGRERLIPLVPELVASVDLEAGTVEVTLPEGLLEL